MKTVTLVTGKCSWFGSPSDTGVGENEGLALVDDKASLVQPWRPLFTQPVDLTRGIARQLKASAHYCAMRWIYEETPRAMLANAIVRVENKDGLVCWCRPADWGPNIRTGRVIDLSPGAFTYLHLNTDDEVTCAVII